MTSFSATTLLALLGASTAFAEYPSAPTYGAGADKCAATCVTAYRTCQGNPANPRSQCASELSSCLGYVPFDNGGSFVTPTACATTAPATTSTSAAPTASASGDACASGCVTAYRTCQGNPANPRSQCASELSSCLGYVPFDNSGSFVTPTACSTSASSTTTTCSTSASSTATTTAPSQTSSAPAPTGDCAATCVAEYRACQGAPDANRAFCASQISSCLGYLPYDNSGSFVTPTACSRTSAAPTQSATTSSAPVQSMTTSAAPNQSTTPSAAPAPTTTIFTSSCAVDCVAAYRACQGAPGANQSLCASNISSCLGYSPFNDSGSFVTPTECSGTPASTSVSTRVSSSPSATTTGPTLYTGAAAIMHAGGPLAAMAAGAAALLI